MGCFSHRQAEAAEAAKNAALERLEELKDELLIFKDAGFCLGMVNFCWLLDTVFLCILLGYVTVDIVNAFPVVANNTEHVNRICENTHT